MACYRNYVSNRAGRVHELWGVSPLTVTADDEQQPVVVNIGPRHSAWVREPRQARSEETLNRFLTATAELLADRPFADISVNDICARADRTVGSFYARFEDKASVLRVLVEQVATELHDEARAWWVPETFEGDTIIEVIERTVDAVLGAYREAGAVFHAAAIDAPNEPAFRDARLGVWIACAEAFGEVLVHRSDEIGHPDPARAAHLAIMAVISMIDVRMIYGSNVPPQGVSDTELRSDLLGVMRAIVGV